ncbi:hypothetical protein FIBSPDRAFT_860327 [Athelia psychrophila]|uniref:Chromatin target of PRMT1 protein C-terminal domain-containing protein n=1 Tax=Athelia psychrophila TaxID=1759441 RepID=A0A166KAN8_9AGAM|nr:hypothetical protein FIBSPDRAFT_860327 [Fibularhizoctonia sp. CBS 109695]
MDIAADTPVIAEEFTETLNYEEVPYEEQLPSLAERIGKNKVYLLEDSSIAKGSKRKHGSEETEDVVVDEDGDAEMEEDPTLRPTALLFTGSPIAHLPTARLFAYATHFDAKPLGLEWVSDNTCVFVFESKAAARAAHSGLQKSASEEADEEGLLTAQPIPVAIWPPEQRINATLGTGEGLKGIIKMRRAKVDDVKKKGAKKESDFYRRYGETAGKEIGGERPEAPAKRRRRDEREDGLTAEQLDDELDNFLADDDPEPEAPRSPPSRMYSDQIANDGRTLLERTRDLPVDLSSRITARLPRRARERDAAPGERPANGRSREHAPREGRSRGGRERKERTAERPKKSQQDLDDELDAFLSEPRT